MRPDVEPALQVARVQDGRKQLVAPVAEAVEDAEADVVHPRLQAAVEARRAPVVVALHAPRRVHGLVELAVVRLLEDLERADANRAQHLQVGDGKRRGVHVHAADRVEPARTRRGDLARVARLDRLGDVLGRGRRMLAVDGDEALVADAPGEDVQLILQLVHREDAALLQGVALAEAAVFAAVHAEVRHVERREHDDAVVVDLVLDAVGGRAHLLEERRVRHLHEDGRLLREQGLARRFRLGDDLAHPHGVGGLAVRLGDEAVDERIVDEVLAAGQVLVDLVPDDEVLRVVRRVLEFANARAVCHCTPVSLQ